MIASMLAMKKNYPRQSKDVLVTQKMLYAVRDELTHKIASSTHGLKSQISKLESAMAKLSAQMYRTLTLVEEQNARNIVVMDGLTSLFGRQDRVESRVDEIENTIASFRK
jgi:hypothetical protein